MEMMRKYDYSKLLGRIKEKGYTQDTLAAKAGVSAATMNQKLCNKGDFKQSEIKNICTILDIPFAEIPAYFFCNVT